IESLESAVHRITGLPAKVYDLPSIGLLKEGMAADITVFDYAGLKCNADYDFPYRKNEGIKYVIVNGGIAVENGNFTGLKNGKVLRKGK
ncbi:MAG: amidohydrolase family protein, partial [Clostridia bacterium]|nr:amidohydrolase family protein [Clostridia bacterium]